MVFKNEIIFAIRKITIALLSVLTAFVKPAFVFTHRVCFFRMHLFNHIIKEMHTKRCQSISLHTLPTEANAFYYYVILFSVSNFGKGGK